MSAERKTSPAAGDGAHDRFRLYQLAVQEPEADIEFVVDVYRRRFGRRPYLLREDFCGTALFACEWVGTHPRNQAWAIDLDEVPLDWGERHNVARLDAGQRSRLHLVRGDVRKVRHRRVDVVVAFNFSYFVFRERGELLTYFRAARRGLQEPGMLFLDLYGGPGAQERVEEVTPYDGFDYVWDQDEFDAIQQRTRCYIHFDVPGGKGKGKKRRIERAFEYDWRLWTIPELRDALADAGFSRTEVYWEGTDEETGEGDGNFRRAESAENSDSWIAYLVAVKS